MGEFLEALLKNSASDIYPFHMPGHKRTRFDDESEIIAAIRDIDITEITGFDDLHKPEGLILQLLDRLSRVFGSEESRILVNGSTGGILSAISSVCTAEDKIIIARNSHKAAYNAIMLRQAKPVFIYPETDNKSGIYSSLTAAKIEAAAEENPDAKAIFITSPTYEGIISDIKGIADLAHKKGMLLIVDEAHGAHLGFDKYAIEKYGMDSAIHQGADIVVQSLHKTLPCFTQTSVIHFKKDLSCKDELLRYLSIYQTSSPSYIFMAGVDNCLDVIESRGKELFSQYINDLEDFYEKSEGFKSIYVKRPEKKPYDIGKIVIASDIEGLTGSVIKDILRIKYHLEMEMAGQNYALAMTSIMDSKEGLNRLLSALEDMNEHLADIERYSGSTAKRIETSNIKAGDICDRYIYAYPPGIPIIIPGERFDENILDGIERLQNSGIDLYSGK